MNELGEYMSNMLNGIGGGSTTTPEEPNLPSDGSFSEEKGVNTPNLGEGMTAIKWDETANNGAGDWVETTGNDADWYDYSAKKWANAKTSDGSMWVWIPRFAYSITSGYHQSGADLNSTTPAEGAGTIEVEFMKGTSNEGATGKTITDYTTATVNAETTHKFVDENYVVHPAFTYGNTVSGIWVAKFEASPEGATTDVANSEYNGTDKKLQVKPGVSSWRSITISNIYDVCKNYNSALNSHMMKNDEWGAVAYLSKSKYGKESEVTINSNSSYYTGGGSGNAYVSNVGQSTTGNVWGVYDMSGGAWEYVAAYVNNGNSSLTDYGASLVNGDAKTKNVYDKASSDNNQNNYNQNAGKYGDAVYETSGNGNSSSGSWYGDYSSFPDSGWPFFGRGGYYSGGSGAGVFYFNVSNGYGDSSRSFRPVLVAL